MTDRIMTLFKMFGSRGGMRTLDKPNSWAVVALWRRAMQLKEEEQEERVEAFAEIVESLFDAKKIRPVADAEHVRLRKDILQEHYRNQKMEMTKQVHREEMQRQQQGDTQQRTQQVVNHPNLDIPVGGHYVTLAQ